MGTEPFIGEIRLFSMDYAPRGWLTCSGQVLAIQQNQALFSILGTTYGGNGVTTFQLPNLQGSVAVHPSSSIVLGQRSGVTSVQLQSNQIGHTHTIAGNATANSTVAGGNFPAAAPPGKTLYGPNADTTLAGTFMQPSGSSQPHNNLQPYLVMTYCIAIQGIFPSRS